MRKVCFKIFRVCADFIPPLTLFLLPVFDIYLPDPWLTARVDYLQPNHGRDAWRKAVWAKRGAWRRASISERRRAKKFEKARAALK